MDHNIEGNVIVITGRSSGLGEATARLRRSVRRLATAVSFLVGVVGRRRERA
jgi:NADP-dependent 3-hydroxy acid dehydrogenase YdfG